MLTPFAVQIAVALLAVFSIGGVIVAALYPRLSGEAKSEKRLESVAGSKRKPNDRISAVNDEARRKRSVEDTLKELEEAQKAKARKNRKPTLTTRMRQAGLTWSKRTYYLICAAVALGVTAVFLVVFGFGPIPSVGFGLSGGVLLPHFYVNFVRKRRFKQFSNEFPNAVDVIVRGVNGAAAGRLPEDHAAEAAEPVAGEFREIVEDQTLGMPLADAVTRLPERIPLSEANFFAIVIAIQSRTGGSLSEALSNLSKVLRDRKKMNAKIRAMSAEAKSSAGIIGALPIVVALLVYVTSPDYVLLLLQTTIGNIVLAVCGMWMFMGIMVMRKMINFDY